MTGIGLQEDNSREVLALPWERVSSLSMERGVLQGFAVIPQRSVLRRARGFTLVELAVVVTIVAVLSVIALVGYRKYMLNSKMTEAQSMISGIKIAQEDHRSEKGSYADIGKDTWCPSVSGAGTGKVKAAWDPTCNGGKAPWNTLAVHVEGPLHFQYVTTASNTWVAPTIPEAGFVTWGTPAVTANYIIVARCDLDPGGDVTALVGSSVDNRIFTDKAGE